MRATLPSTPYMYVRVYNPSTTPSRLNLNSMQIVDKFRSQYIPATKAVSRLALQTST